MRIRPYAERLGAGRIHSSTSALVRSAFLRRSIRVYNPSVAWVNLHHWRVLLSRGRPELDPELTLFYHRINGHSREQSSEASLPSNLTANTFDKFIGGHRSLVCVLSIQGCSWITFNTSQPLASTPGLPRVSTYILYSSSDTATLVCQGVNQYGGPTGSRGIRV